MRRNRNKLIATYAPLLGHIVEKRARDLPAHCDLEQVVSRGLAALMDSLDTYKPEMGGSIEQYAWDRIHRAVVDELLRQSQVEVTLQTAI